MTFVNKLSSFHIFHTLCFQIYLEIVNFETKNVWVSAASRTPNPNSLLFLYFFFLGRGRCDFPCSDQPRSCLSPLTNTLFSAMKGLFGKGIHRPYLIYFALPLARSIRAGLSICKLAYTWQHLWLDNYYTIQLHLPFKSVWTNSITTFVTIT